MVSAGVVDAAGGDGGVARRSEGVQLVATVLLGLAAVLTGWATFESTKWSGVQADQYSQGGALRTEAVRFSTLAGQQVQIDVALFTGWLDALRSDVRDGVVEQPNRASEYVPDPDTLSGFLFERLGDRLEPATIAWLATDPFTEPNAPAAPFFSAMTDNLKSRRFQFATLALASGALFVGVTTMLTLPIEV